ncbi:MAG: phage major capsid protein [Treponema sp.]|nr:phage major capsid protein [Treponema sp.]
MDKLRQLQQRFNELVKQLRGAQGEQSPDACKVAAIETEIRALAGQIETEKAIIRTHEGIEPETRSGESTPATGEAQREENREAVLAYMRTGNRAHLRAMTSGITGGGDTGGYLIPQEWEDRILEREREQFVMRNLADVQMSALDRNIPIADNHGESNWIEEGGKYIESEAEFSRKLMEAHKLGRIVRVSEELLQDNTYNLEAWLIDAFAYSNGLAMEEAYVKGDGNKKPRGFLLDCKTVPAKGAKVEYADLLALFAALNSGYFINASWMMNTNTLVEIMLLKDGAGQFLYRPFNTPASNGPIGTILGRNVVLSSFMPDIAGGEKPIALGDFKRYRIHDRRGFTIQRLDELYAANGFIGFRGMQRTDGRLLIDEAIQVLRLPGGSAAPPSSSSGT